MSQTILINSHDKPIVLAKTVFKTFKKNKKIYYCFGCFVVIFWHSRKLVHTKYPKIVDLQI